ncbi:MAG: hypothetical protein PVG39_11310 [Desulfobacteraceae bacterium]|jgi:hypothetical protein
MWKWIKEEFNRFIGRNDRIPLRLTFRVERSFKLPNGPAGPAGYTDTIEVIVKSGDPGGNIGAFQEWMRSSLAEWYEFDQATVFIKTKEK